MLYPAVQPGSAAPYVYPKESVTLAFAGSLTEERRLEGGDWRAVELKVPTGPELRLDVSWRTTEDPRPRALALRRVLLPWARKPEAPEPPREIPEIAGADREAGRAIFYGPKAACFKCHAVGGEGGKLGPDLSNLPHRDYASVLKDIEQPSAAINPDHVGYAVRLKSGDVLSGVVAGEADGKLTLGTATGETVTVERASIAEIRPSTVSVMPEGLLKALSPAERRDLMGFLLGTSAGK
jgi:putative heme-binding domain-containing protein